MGTTLKKRAQMYIKKRAPAQSKLVTNFSPDEAEKVSRDLHTLASEATSKAPRKAWYELSGQGLIEAAKTVAAMAGPVTTAVKAVLSLLAG